MSRKPRPVLSVEEALERILNTVPVLGTETVGLLDAAGGVLAETILADRDIPPTSNSAMDGYAVRSSDLKEKGRLQIVGEVRAGGKIGLRVKRGTAVRIMPGASMPPGADTVVRFEDTKVEGEWLTIKKAPAAGANVRAAGEDVRAGQVVLQPGTVLRPQETGMLAAVGRTRVSVVRRPRVAILATGDEVVPPDRTRLELQGETPGGGPDRIVDRVLHLEPGRLQIDDPLQRLEGVLHR